MRRVRKRILYGFVAQVPSEPVTSKRKINFKGENGQGGAEAFRADSIISVRTTRVNKCTAKLGSSSERIQRENTITNTTMFGFSIFGSRRNQADDTSCFGILRMREINPAVCT